MNAFRMAQIVVVLGATALSVSTSYANAYMERGKLVQVGKSGMTVTPPRDWNRLSIKPGKFAETWTLDGEQLNEVTFYGGVESGNPLIRERNKKREPLPKLSSSTLLVEIPELLEGTYRAYRKIGSFTLTSSQPDRFLGREGVYFTYDYTDQDNLPRRGEARAVLIAKKLYMVTFDAPRLHYFQRTLSDFKALAETAQLTR